MNAKQNTFDLSGKDINSTTKYFSPWIIFFAFIYVLILIPTTSFAGKIADRGFNSPPSAKIKRVVLTGVAPYEVIFDAERSRDRDGKITTYQWNFGDGKSGTGSRISHVFNTTGDFTVTLLVIDDEGGTGTTNVQINVVPLPEAISIGERPVGIYSKNKVLDIPFVSGVAYKVKWSEVEREEGVYDFSGIEEAIEDAVLVGQSVTITTMLKDEPRWLMRKIPQEDKYRGIQGTDIVPWNEVMLQALEKLAQAQSRYKVHGIQLRDHPTVKQISASVGTMNSIRMKTIPRNYTPDLLKQGVKRSIRTWANNYPDKLLFVGLFGINDGIFESSNQVSETTLELRDELLDEFDGVNKPRLNFFIEYMTGQNPQVSNELLFDVKDSTSILMQACGAWSEQDTKWIQCDWIEPVDTPEKGLNHAMDNFNTTYFEIYKVDLENPEYTEQFEDAAIRVEELAEDLN